MVCHSLFSTLSQYMSLFCHEGSVIHLRSYRQHTIVINSYEDCVEFFERRSNIYSDRPTITMVDMYVNLYNPFQINSRLTRVSYNLRMGWTSFNAGFMRYGPEWRAHRRMYNQAFKPEASLNYRPTQTRKVNDFLYGLVNTPEDWENHNRT
jgi:cytochrome P450